VSWVCLPGRRSAEEQLLLFGPAKRKTVQRLQEPVSDVCGLPGFEDRGYGRWREIAEPNQTFVPFGGSSELGCEWTKRQVRLGEGQLSRPPCKADTSDFGLLGFGLLSAATTTDQAASNAFPRELAGCRGACFRWAAASRNCRINFRTLAV
jgi:hypothetical protein